MKIGLLSDTHGFLDPVRFTTFADCDEVWHAGDIGTAEVADRLLPFKPLRAVHGNVDDAALRRRFPVDLHFSVEGLRVWITHIAGSPGHYDKRVRDTLARDTPDLLICGHSHILRVKKDPKFPMLYMNPGAAGQQGFHPIRTVLMLEIVAGKIKNVNAVELGPRGRLGA